MKKTLMILGIILLIIALPFSSMVVETMTAQTEPVKEVREGDVIFQTSQSQQSPLIQIATRSKISHCGIIVMKNGLLTRISFLAAALLLLQLLRASSLVKIQN